MAVVESQRFAGGVPQMLLLLFLYSLDCLETLLDAAECTKSMLSSPTHFPKLSQPRKVAGEATQIITCTIKYSIPKHTDTRYA